MTTRANNLGKDYEEFTYAWGWSAPGSGFNINIGKYGAVTSHWGARSDSKGESFNVFASDNTYPY